MLLIFLDGVGVGEDDPRRNPFLSARLPTFEALLGGVPTLARPAVSGGFAGRVGHAAGVDATLGVEGTPQSGTGQASLLTGRNGAAEFGRHFGPWIPTALRPAVRDANLLVRARDDGHRVAFANAWPRGWTIETAGRRVAGPPLAALGAGVLDRHVEHLVSGEALASEIVSDPWIHTLGPPDLPRPTPECAGRILGRVATPGGVTLFAHFATDTVGHARDLAAGAAQLERVDTFLAGVLAALPPAHPIVIISDHGNLEDVTTGHTRNPALGIVVGGAAPGGEERARRAASALRSLTDLPDVVLGLLD
ncbi:MAG: hypothetical protein RQ745_09235 [Longimicrobiales bacterium]|nr:hypothetical protein [Longimicrobiales bacterium]